MLVISHRPDDTHLAIEVRDRLRSEVDGSAVRLGPGPCDPDADGVVVVVGPGWAERSDPYTGLSVTDRHDGYGRVLGSILGDGCSASVTVVLVRDAEFPSTHDLPAHLKPLAAAPRYEGVAELIEELAGGTDRRAWAPGLAAGLVVVGAVVVAAAVIAASGAPSTIGYVGAWQQWWSGELSADEVWAGWRLLYWGRLGKIVAAAAALVILADIAGESRLRSIGETLRRWSQIDRADVALIAYAIVGSVGWVVVPWLYDRVPWLITGLGVVALVIVALVALLHEVMAKGRGWEGEEWRKQHEAEVRELGDVAAALLLGPLWLALAGVFLAFAAIAWPIGVLLAHDSSKNVLRVVSVVLVLIGFHFDLLADA